jgi:hypothetical protein
VKAAWNVAGGTALLAWAAVTLDALGIPFGAALIALLGVIAVALLVIALWPSRTTKGDHQ